MCGICGVLSWREPEAPAHVEAMTTALAHRGPDGQGLHLNGAAALGHRRLSIIDLSDAAAEPMPNEDRTLWLVFNGEIYNFRELRKDLERRHQFRSRSDGEVILHLYEEKGDEVASALDGMFAFALWDAKARRLLLGRDRAGKKPLYYHARPGFFAFASEVKSLLAHPLVPKDQDPAALPLYLAYGYVPTPGTFYRHIRSLPPAHRMAVTEAGAEPPEPYWSIRFRDGGSLPEAEAEERFRGLLGAAVRRRLVADVPLGAFLSGGLDSSAVVAFMAEGAAGRVRTFTIGFVGDTAYDETRYARVVAERFATDHTEFVVEPKAVELIDRLVWHHDGPFGDSSAVPTYLLSELTRSKVTVALNGDGGDEVFAGYLRLYGGALSERLPRWAFRGLGAAVGLLPEPADRKHPLRFLKRFADAGRLPLAERILRWNGYFPSPLTLLRPESLEWGRPDLVLASYAAELGGESSPLARLLQQNFKTYLLDDLLVKMDRCSMAHGLEARSPFLDTAVAEFGASLPNRLRMKWGKGKLLLRRAMRDILPPSILARGKMGFGAPLGTWFRGDLQPLVQERLLPATSPLYEHLRPEPVTALVAAHMSHSADLSPQIWSLLTLESWLRQQNGVRS
jgi:asparagine synthase (glutamine-hydrolysing)